MNVRPRSVGTSVVLALASVYVTSLATVWATQAPVREGQCAGADVLSRRARRHERRGRARARPRVQHRGINTRRAEPRNTPTVFNAALTIHNFWDRRARNIFNGVNPHSAGDASARLLRASGLAQIAPVVVRIHNASLASQAVGPPLSDREMGSLGRTFLDVGKRLASAKPLRQQQVAEDRRSSAERLSAVISTYSNI